jgi:hypothetical protein
MSADDIRLAITDDALTLEGERHGGDHEQQHEPGDLRTVDRDHLTYGPLT